MLMRLKSIKSNNLVRHVGSVDETEEKYPTISIKHVGERYGSVVRLKSIKSNNLSMMSVRDMAVLVRLKKNIQQSVHHVGERCGGAGETEEKYSTICPPIR